MRNFSRTNLYINIFKRYHCLIIPLICVYFLCACSDNKLEFDYPEDPEEPWKDPEMVCLPINISIGKEPSTKADENGFVYGDDHRIDFSTSNECFAIFFDRNKKVSFIKPLYTPNQLGEGTEETDNGIEYSVTAVAYVRSSDVANDRVEYLLVVLNGKPIYQEFYNKIYSGVDEVNDVGLSEILDVKWTNHAKYFEVDNSLIGRVDEDNSPGTIGIHKDANNRDLLTMTNSIYYDEKNQLVSAVKLDKEKNFYKTVSEYMNKPDNDKHPAIVYVERMVSKFMAPTFNTEVLGSDRVFRPDDKAQPVVIYWFDKEKGNLLFSEQQHWRIHLRGWTINGTESENYVFKKIPGADWDGWNNWNSPGFHRSYWSIDPHYNITDKFNDFGIISEYGEHFYPWQFRRASDRSDIISVQGGMFNDEQRIPVLRYNAYNDVEWEENALYMHENTFDPNVFHPENKLNYDGRTPVLVGSHLLITGELYLPKENGEYMGEYGIYEHVYSDRARRYYFNELDWVKMFVRDFNRALVAQEKMSFPVYNWDGEWSGKSAHKYTITSPGNCQLYFEGKPLTVDRIDQLAQESDVSFSIVANAQMGDGRLMPWIQRGTEILKVLDENGNELIYEQDGETPTEQNWTYDMYMSLFYEWFGPIDHYKDGKLYYAGAITHNSKEGSNSSYDYYGNVRNHLYRFKVNSINGIGSPLDDHDQIIIPESYGYYDMIMVYLEIIPYHQKSTLVDIPNK